MRRTNRWIHGGLLVAAIALAGCSPAANAAPPAAVTVTKIEGSDLKVMTLTADAAKRLDVQTIEVTNAPSGRPGTVVPYSALLYDLEGNTWVYTNPQGLDFVRASVTVDRIEGDAAFLKAGPQVGTKVVTVGVSEFHGVEAGVGGGH